MVTVMNRPSTPSRSGRRPGRRGTVSETSDTDQQAGYDPGVVAWVTESCERHGVAVKVLDAAVVARVAVLLGAPSHPNSSRRSRPGSPLEPESPGGPERGELSA